MQVEYKEGEIWFPCTLLSFVKMAHLIVKKGEEEKVVPLCQWKTHLATVGTHTIPNTSKGFFRTSLYSPKSLLAIEAREAAIMDFPYLDALHYFE
jgi:hypothetical protein